MRCPECQRLIDHLCYAVDLREYGSCNFDGGDFNFNDSNYNGSPDYSCPECGDMIDLDDLIDPDEEEDGEEEEEVEGTPPTLEEGGVCSSKEGFLKGRYSGFDKIKILSCKKCKMQALQQSGFDSCPMCGSEVVESII